MRKKGRRKRKPAIPVLTPEIIKEPLESSLKGAEELHEKLKSVFQLPDHNIRMYAR